MDMNVSAFPPESDQLDAIDLHAGPRTFTIDRTDKGPDDKRPVNVFFREFPRPWRPNRGTGRTLEKAWGVDQEAWAGRRVTLFCDPNVMFGKERRGGIRISHLSDISSELKVNVGTLRPEWVTVHPIPDAPAPLTDAMIASATEEQLRAWWKQHPGQRAAIEAQVAELKAAEDGPNFPEGGAES